MRELFRVRRIEDLCGFEARDSARGGGSNVRAGPSEGVPQGAGSVAGNSDFPWFSGALARGVFPPGQGTRT